MPLLLKPAPTRLRLALWALEKGLDHVPDSPPPGLVTIPHETDRPDGYYTMSGYRPAASRAIRIDMLERLADMLRGKDTRGGFEATADMLSITGLTLEQFADLMGGLGYRADRGERPKVKAAPEPAPAISPESAPETGPERASETGPETGTEPAATDAPETIDETPLGEAPSTGLEGADTPDPTPQEIPADPPGEAPDMPSEAPDAPPSEVPGDAPSEAPAETPTEVSGDAPPETGAATDAETEVFYTFTWAPRRRGGDRPQRRPEGGFRQAPRREAEGRRKASWQRR